MLSRILMETSKPFARKLAEHLALRISTVFLEEAIKTSYAILKSKKENEYQASKTKDIRTYEAKLKAAQTIIDTKTIQERDEKNKKEQKAPPKTN